MRSSLPGHGARGFARLRGALARTPRGSGCAVRDLWNGCCRSGGAIKIRLAAPCGTLRRREGWHTSGLACKASTSSCEKRTGLSLWEGAVSWAFWWKGRGNETGGPMAQKMGSYLAKTCWVLEGGGLEVL